MLMHQLVANLGKPESCFIVSETRSSEGTEMHVSEARCVAVPVLQAEVDHPTGVESPEVGIDVHRRCRDREKDLQKVEHILVGRHRQVQEVFDWSASQQRPDTVVFFEDLFTTWVRRPIRTETSEVFKKHLDAAIEAIQGGADR